MRRIVIIGTTLVVLGAAASAYALNNTYTATASFSVNKAGSVKLPSPLGFKTSYTASGTGGNRTAPLTNITNTFYGLTSNGRDFPTCSLSTIATAENDTGCKKGARVGSGTLTAALGPASNLTSTASTTPCARKIHVWNAGQGKLVYFLYGPPNTCGGLGTGAVGPFPGSLMVKSGTLTLDLPIPNSISFPVPGLQGSLLTDTITYSKRTTKANGRTVGFFSSVGCKHGNRAYTTSFTAGGETSTLAGAARCTK